MPLHTAQLKAALRFSGTPTRSATELFSLIRSREPDTDANESQPRRLRVPWEGGEAEQLFNHRVEMTEAIATPAPPVPMHKSGVRRPVDPPAHLYEDTDFAEFSENGGPVQEPELVSDPLTAGIQNHQTGLDQGPRQTSRNIPV